MNSQPFNPREFKSPVFLLFVVRSSSSHLQLGESISRRHPPKGGGGRREEGGGGRKEEGRRTAKRIKCRRTQMEYTVQWTPDIWYKDYSTYYCTVVRTVDSGYTWTVATSY